MLAVCIPDVAPRDLRDVQPLTALAALTAQLISGKLGVVAQVGPINSGGFSFPAVTVMAIKLAGLKGNRVVSARQSFPES